MGDLDNVDVRAAFRAEVRRSTRATAIATGLIAIFAFPAWAGFDYLVEPAQAGTFTKLRLLLELPLVGLWLVLFTGSGRRHPERVMLLMLALIEGTIAFMISRLEEAYAPYALGMSLAIYGSSFLLVWPWPYTAALIGLTWVALAGTIATAPVALGGSALATIAFYMGTASIVAFVGQVYRQTTAWREFRARLALEREQARSEKLLRQLARLSSEDPLTGLANRRSWDEALAREFERSRRQEGSFAVLLCDLDLLKDVNDRFGHATGDLVLKAAADVLRERVRAGDLAARLGGDEFAVLCADTDLDGARAFAEDLRNRLHALHPRDAELPSVTLSIGVAVRKPTDGSPTELMLRADNRLYRAKRTRNSVCCDERIPVA